MKKYREKEHKKFVKYMRKVNKAIENDPYLGIGRFRMDLYSEKWFNFEDGSGCILDFRIKISDKLTGNTAIFMCDNFNYSHIVFRQLNDFMVRSSVGTPGHYPPLRYLELNINEVIYYREEF